ncbi:MAG: primosomal protein N' [Paludibacter sp.]
MKYIDVILPLPLRASFTYQVPDIWESEIRVGMRVIVPFGKKKLYTAIVYIIHTQPPTLPYEIKEIAGILDANPILRYPQLRFWEWISSYYMACMGDVFQAAVPAGMKIESETTVCINPEFEAETALAPKEQEILDVLSDGKATTVDALSKLLSFSNILPVLKNLLDKNAVEINEELTEKVRAKTEIYIRIQPEYNSEEKLRDLFDELKRAKKQLDLLMSYIDLSKMLIPSRFTEVSKKSLLEKSGASAAVLNGMLEKNIFECYKKEVSRFSDYSADTREIQPLNEFQQVALRETELKFLEKPVVLLHGVTSSGKTEIYIHLIKKTISEGNQVLYLVPEIALTTQLTSRLKRVFGDRLGVYHSRFSDAERVEIWNNVLNDKSYDIIIGVRSSIFLPFRKLGLIIIDEEHESSYKQYDPAPRYNARNAAIMLGTMHGAKTLLGTATPSIESYHNALNGKYGLVEIAQRHNDMKLPDFMIVDTKEAYHKKQMNGHFSDTLIAKMSKALENREQIILFQNRRGYAPYIECKQCAHVPKCKNCDVSLTVHKAFNILSCHYCGYTEPIPAICPACKTPGLGTKGFGTEKIEDEIKIQFPDARIARMDYDTTRSKKAYERIITDFEQQKIDILIGTQMVTKGLDFECVSIVGILNADNMLNFPDYRAHERAYQLMAQVSGRAGRKHKQGLVILQTSVPEHPVIKQVLNNDYASMFKTQQIERQEFKYPPFYRIIEIELRHRDIQICKQSAHELANQLRAIFGTRILGPVEPPVSRIQNMFIRQIIIKIENEASPIRAKELIHAATDTLLSDNRFKAVRLSIDVDPL